MIYGLLLMEYLVVPYVEKLEPFGLRITMIIRTTVAIDVGGVNEVWKWHEKEMNLGKNMWNSKDASQAQPCGLIGKWWAYTPYREPSIPHVLWALFSITGIYDN